MKLNCNDVLEALPLYVGDDFSKDSYGRQQFLQVKEHLSTCLLCEEEYRSYRYCRELLGEVADSHVADASDAFWSPIEKEIDSNKHSRWRFGWVSLAASFAILFFAIQFLNGDSVAIGDSLIAEESFLIVSDEKIDMDSNTLARQLTLEEQINFLNQQKHFYGITPLNRLGVPPTVMVPEQPSVVNY